MSYEGVRNRAGTHHSQTVATFTSFFAGLAKKIYAA